MTYFCVQVALDVPLCQVFSYLTNEPNLPCGSRVIVPFHYREMSGIVVGHEDPPVAYANKLRHIKKITHDMPSLSSDILALCRFVSTYYQYPFGQVLATALPSIFRSTKLVKLTNPFSHYQVADLAILLDHLPLRARVQRQIATALTQAQSASDLQAISPNAMKWVRDWIKLGWVKQILPRLTRIKQTGPTLNEEQHIAVNQLSVATGFSPFLLYGITGSGKTEVYLHLIAKKLKEGHQILILVPEISLTPQLEKRFVERFPENLIVSLHSRLNDTERAQNWLLACSGEAHLILGTRLAVFTPLPRLGLIVIDEEHDPSYKQQTGLRYSARDVAVYRAQQQKIPIILGSATPSIESWQNIQTGRYQLLELSKRAAGAHLPQLKLLSMHRSKTECGLHETAVSAIRRALHHGEQVLVFVNRRGYAPVLACSECGWTAKCAHCSVRLVVHLSERRLRCHHCGYEILMTTACPDCHNQDIRPWGQGTQKVEMALSTLFPHHRIVRIDRDSTRLKGSLDTVLNTIHAGEVDILVGTQMLAKGHDFSKLTCVLVLEADSGLFSVDFRAEERLFALLVQVAGRAGRRNHRGEVLVQTAFPNHPFYQELLSMNYRLFAHRILNERQALRLPPSTAWALFRAEANTLKTAIDFLSQLRSIIPNMPTLYAYEPVAASLSRKAGRERAQLLLVADQRSILQSALTTTMSLIETIITPHVHWSLDVDPLEV